MISKRIFFKTFEVTDRKSTIVKILAPIEPRVILCVGLNYRKLAEATGSKFPELQNPGDPIVLPTHLRSDADLGPGDFVEIEIEKIGVLSNPVVSEE